MKKMLLLPALFWLSNAVADESPVELKPGQGRDVVVARCSFCHSLEYIPMNGGFLDHDGWQKIVDKMVNVMGAPIDQDNKDVIVQYLTKYYGN